MKEKAVEIESCKNRSEMWTHAYAPKSIEDLVGNEENLRRLITWLAEWDNVHIKKIKLLPVSSVKNWAVGFWPVKMDPNKK